MAWIKWVVYRECNRKIFTYFCRKQIKDEAGQIRNNTSLDISDPCSCKQGGNVST